MAKTLTIELSKKDIRNIDVVLQKIAEAIEDGFTSGIDFPVDWSLEQTDSHIWQERQNKDLQNA